MADGIRGKHYEYLPSEVQKGIVLHRAIDTYTDAHPIFRQSTKRLHQRYHHYAGVIVDVFLRSLSSQELGKLLQRKIRRFCRTILPILRYTSGDID